MDDFDKYLEEQLKNPDFKKEWDDHEMEHQLTMMLMKVEDIGSFSIEKIDLSPFLKRGTKLPDAVGECRQEGK